MPIYEYECRTCGEHFERIQRFSDAPVAECPRGHHNIHRVFSAPAIIFNGPGFYVTDNPKNGAGRDGLGSKLDKKEKKEDRAPAAAECTACP